MSDEKFLTQVTGMHEFSNEGIFVTVKVLCRCGESVVKIPYKNGRFGVPHKCLECGQSVVVKGYLAIKEKGNE